jgi:hypothetical protein
VASPAHTHTEPTAAKRTFAGYDEFFAYYLSQHSDRRNRALHLCGTLAGVTIVAAAFSLHHPWWALAWAPVSYGFAWTGHFLIERNRPATFGHPWWSFIADFHMLWRMVTGGMKRR